MGFVRMFGVRAQGFKRAKKPTAQEAVGKKVAGSSPVQDQTTPRVLFKQNS